MKLPIIHSPYSDNVITAPPVTRVSVHASKEWYESAGDNKEMFANAIIDHHAGDIIQFFQTMLQAYSAGIVANLTNDRSYPDLHIRCEFRQNLAYVSLDVYPENVQAKPGELETGGIFVVEVPFTGYPVVVPDGQQPFAWGAWGPYVWDMEATSKGPVTQVGKSGVCVTPLEDLAYFEVEIATIADGVHETVTLTPGTSDGSSTETDIWTTSPAEFDWLFPGDLDHWLSPVIGVVSEDAVNKDWKKNTITDDVIIGCDGLNNKTVTARSIGVQPSLVRYSNYTYNTWEDAKYTIDNATYMLETGVQIGDATVYGEHGGYAMYQNQSIFTFGPTMAGPSGPSPLAASFPMWEDTNPSSRKDEDKTKIVFSGTPGDIHADSVMIGVDGLHVFQVFGNHLQWSTGAFPTQALITKMNQMSQHQLFMGSVSSGDIAAAYLGDVGSFTKLPLITGDVEVETHKYVWQVAGTLGYTPGKTTGASVSDYILIGDVFQGPDFDYYKYCAMGGPSFSQPAGINALGLHAWVLKGRGDKLASTLTHTNDVKLGGAHDGVWTGVDLKSLEKDDVIMIAVNIKKREIYFGKNKKWYDVNGVSDYRPGSDGLLPATYLDGDPKKKYYPACSSRLGYAKMKIRFGTAVRYPPPPGYKAYNTITFSTPGS